MESIHVARVPRLVAGTHDLHVLLRHRLLPSRGGFQCLVPISEVPLPYDQAPLQVEKLKPLPVYGDAAAGPVPPRPNRDQEFVSQIEELLRLQSEVLECVEPVSPELQVPVVAVEDRLQVGRRQVVAGPIFDSGIKAHEEDIEVSASSSRVSPHYTASEDQPPKPRSRRQPHPGLTEETEKTPKAKEQALV